MSYNLASLALAGYRRVDDAPCCIAKGVALVHHSTGKRGVSYDPSQRRQRRDIPSIVRRVTLGVVVVWLALVASLSGWVAQRLTAEELDNLAAGAEYEAQITGRVVDRLFTEMASVANIRKRFVFMAAPG